MNRKKFLSVCVLSTCLFGLVFICYPFIASWNPNNTETRVFIINVKETSAGTNILFEWHGMPAVFYKPDKASIHYLISLNNEANGPDFDLENIPNFFIYTPISTYMGCGLIDTNKTSSPSFKYEGYFDPCHRGFWDKAGRLLPNIHAGKGLKDLDKISSYTWISDNVIRIEGGLPLKHKKTAWVDFL